MRAFRTVAFTLLAMAVTGNAARADECEDYTHVKVVDGTLFPSWCGNDDPSTATSTIADPNQPYTAAYGASSCSSGEHKEAGICVKDVHSNSDDSGNPNGITDSTP
jgi:hypothetical protein